MDAKDSIVYVAGPQWSRDPSYHRTLALARNTGATMAVLSDMDPGGPRPAAIRRALPENAAMVVRVMDRNEPAYRFTLGQGERAWLRGLPCSVWLVPGRNSERSRRILAAVELRGDSPDPLDEAVVATAADLARTEGAQLLLVHAWALIGEPIIQCPLRGLGPARARQVLKQVQQEHRDRMEAFVAGADLGVEALWTLDKGGALDVIRGTLAHTGADTLVMGYRGRGGFWGLVQGNLAECFVGTPETSVIAVRPPREARVELRSREAKRA